MLGEGERGDPVIRTGLTSAEARRRLDAEGANELPRADRRTTLRILGEVVAEPMLALLLGGGLVYLLIGDTGEALILLAFATLSVMIEVIQESRTQRVLEALRDLTSPRALVIRDGRQQRIPGREVVRGDLVVLGEGDRVPADALVCECHDLAADESLLTGEALAVAKRPRRAGDGPERPGGDGRPMVFSGSLIVRGSALAEVTATGERSEIGRIGRQLVDIESEPPRLKRETGALVRLFAVVGVLVTALVVLLYGLTRGDWLEAVLAGIAIGMSMMPEEFPVVLAVFMTMGAWRISRARVLTRRAAAIEALGAATVLCTDKTGTLTENRMTAVDLRLADGAVFAPAEDGAGLPAAFAALVRHGRLASEPVPFDPMELAFHDLARRFLPDGGEGGGRPLHTWGLAPDLLAVTSVWRTADGGDILTVAAKGAPEAIARLCRLDDDARRRLFDDVESMAASGARVLAVAGASWQAGRQLPDRPDGFDFALLGLVGLADPLRASVPAAIAECLGAGIRVIMITGDYPATARAIAAGAGLATRRVMAGGELATLDDAALAGEIAAVDVFARILPEQKLRIVEALKARGEVVAMTGDGVNDAPSLKAAHIGVAMGGRGTDVAREAAAIVLLDDDFGSVVKAVRLGRRIYDNLRKAMGFIFAVHVPIAGLALMPLVFGLPLIFGPVHIAFLEMVIDPVCSLVFEAEGEEDDIMRRPPRPADERLFSPRAIGWGLAQGVVAFVAVAGVLFLADRRGMPEAETRTLTFFALVLTIVALILVNRSFGASLWQAIRRPTAALAFILPSVAIMLALTLCVPFLSRLFGFGPLHSDDLTAVATVAFGVLVVLEAAKAGLDRSPRPGDAHRMPPRAP